MSDLSGKKVMITGAGNGLGHEMALHLAECGAELVIADIDAKALAALSEKIQTTSGNTPLSVLLDVSSEEQWQAAASSVQEHFGYLTGLVNNAGIMLHVPFQQTTLDQFRRTQQVNVEGVFLGCQNCLPLLELGAQKAGSSSIVNISSIFGHVAGLMHSAYAASKGAVNMLSKSLANELPRQGLNIRTNTVHPGVMSAGVSIAGKQAAIDMGVFASPEEADQILMMGNPYGRPGKAEEIPGAIAFLMSDASLLMNGAEITLDGGHTAVY